MRKSDVIRMVRIITVTMLFILIISVCNTIFAETVDDSGIIDFDPEIFNSSTSGENSNTPSTDPTQTPTQQTPEQATPSTNTTTTPSNNGNTSSYTESNIPYAGAETPILMSVAFIVCVIIGIYTFKKVNDYKGL